MALRSLPTSKEVLFLHVVIPIPPTTSTRGGVRNLMAHNGKQEPGNKNQDGKEKGKRQK